MKIHTYRTEYNKLRYAYSLPSPTPLKLTLLNSKGILGTTGKCVESIIVFKCYAL